MTDTGAHSIDHRFYQDSIYYREKVRAMEDTLKSLSKTLRHARNLTSTINRRLAAAEYKQDQGAHNLIIPVGEYVALLGETVRVLGKLAEDLATLGTEEDDHR